MSRIFFSNRKLGIIRNIKNLFIYIYLIKIYYMYIQSDPRGGPPPPGENVFRGCLLRPYNQLYLFVNKIMEKKGPSGRFGVHQTGHYWMMHNQSFFNSDDWFSTVLYNIDQFLLFPSSLQPCRGRGLQGDLVHHCDGGHSHPHTGHHHRLSAAEEEQGRQI